MTITSNASQQKTGVLTPLNDKRIADFSCETTYKDDNDVDGVEVCKDTQGSMQNPFTSLNSGSLPIRDFARIAGTLAGNSRIVSKSQVTQLANQLKTLINNAKTGNFIDFKTLETLRNNKAITPELYNAAVIVAEYGNTVVEKFITDEAVDALAKAVNLDIQRVGKGKPVNVRGVVRGGEAYPQGLSDVVPRPMPKPQSPSAPNKGF